MFYNKITYNEILIHLHFSQYMVTVTVNQLNVLL